MPRAFRAAAPESLARIVRILVRDGPYRHVGVGDLGQLLVPGGAELGRGRLADAEVDDQRALPPVRLRLQDNVLGLEIAMNGLCARR
jgi:hypothetical protein